MRVNRILIGSALAALASPVITPAPLDAQVVVRTVSRGMLGVMTEAVPASGGSQRRVIVDVVPGSPAERAGLVRGDTILTVNGTPATQQVMNAGFEPGAEVKLRVRRGGRERDVNVVAMDRSSGTFVYSAEMLPDSLRGRMSVIMERVRADADTLARRRVWASPGDSLFEYRFRTDSANVYGLRGPVDRVFVDSLRSRFDRFEGEWPRLFADSLVWRNEPGAFAYGFSTDSSGTAGIMWPAEIFAHGFSVGMRAVAGAELSELNPALAEYFGATDGVLVLNARDGTPAARAGLRAGDVIQRAGSSDVSTVAELRRAIDRTPRGQPVTLRVLRRGQVLDLTLGQQRE